jgi:hypothetical protein
MPATSLYQYARDRITLLKTSAVSCNGMILASIAKKAKERKLRTAVLVLVGLLLVLALADILTGTRQLSAYEDDWNDLSAMKSSLKAKGFKTSSLISTSIMLDELTTGESVLAIIGVEKPYLAQEVSAIVEYVERGGYVILADDFGYGSALSEKLAQISFAGKRLWSSAFEKNPAFVKVNVTLDSTPFTLLLNSPTALERVSSNEIRASTYPDSWLDENGNGERDLDEESNPYPVIATINRANLDGAVLIVSDPGMFINDMWNRHDNSKYILKAIGKYFPGAKEVIFDETRHKPTTVREGAWRDGLFLEIFLMDSIYGKAGIGILTVLALIVAASRVRSPAEWRHEDALTEVSLHHLAEQKFRAEDRLRLRAALLEKVRLSLGLYAEEFGRMDASNIEAALGDDKLLELIQNPSGVHLMDMEDMVTRVREWRRR